MRWRPRWHCSKSECLSWNVGVPSCQKAARALSWQKVTNSAAPNNAAKLTTEDVAKIFRVSRSTVVRWTRREGLRAQRVGRGPRYFEHADLVAFLRRHGLTLPPALEKFA